MEKNIGIDAANFALSTTFQITVPGNYNHPTQLASFARKNRRKFYIFRKFYIYNDNITDANFAKATNQLTPGKTYGVKIFQITKQVTSEDCLAFLKTQKAILVGAQGISVVWQQAKENFPKGEYTVSFDEKNACWQDADGDYRVPYLYRDLDGDWIFRLGVFEFGWCGGEYVLCVRDLSA